MSSSFSSPFVQTKNGDRKFIGGAAMQRIKAKKRIKQGARILRPDEVVKSKETISVKLSPFERFFAGLLRSEAREYIGTRDKELWTTICRRLSLPVLQHPLLPCYDSQREHFASRASLVMEESRQALADSIRLFEQQSRQNNRPKNAKNNNGSCHRREQEMVAMEVTLKSVDNQEKTGHSILVFEKQNLSKVDIYMLKYGNVFACIQSKVAATVENIVLGAVMPQSRDEMEKSNSFAVMVFKAVKKATQEKWCLVALTSLLSEQRKFDACMELTSKRLPILFPVLGKKKGTHLRFQEDGDGKSVSIKAEDSGSDSDCEMLEVIDVEATFQLPRLNHSQEAAAQAFLSSKPQEITLIQGPPGTGKTTLLTSVIGRYVVESKEMDHAKRQLLVCAPTNKAITVLCTRFLNSFIDSESDPCNAVLVGDDEKLINDDFHSEKRTGKSPSRLRSIFLYTFIDAIRDDYIYIQRTLLRNATLSNGTLCKLRQIARRLYNKLTANVSDVNALSSAGKIVELIAIISPRNPNSVELVDELNLILRLMDEWNRESVWREMLQRADVIFCTLASSGASFLRKSISQVEDLIVDEAAASTEPELYIPFSYMPARMLAVGDPKQLPATVSSVTAESLGLSRSLHERLMYHCSYDHVMLDTQYRMKPEISRFPSHHFYSQKLKNGRNVLSSAYTNGITIMAESPYTMFQVNGTERQGRSGSYENVAEAHAVVEIIEAFRTPALQRYGKDWCSSDRLRVITFYQAQVALISRLLQQKGMASVLVATVDSSQGCEADHVVVSFVRSEGVRSRSSVGFLADERRLNVGLTRAKYQLICVGNIERMCTLLDSRAKAVRHLALDAKERKCIVPFVRCECEKSSYVSRKRSHDIERKVFDSKRRSVPVNRVPVSETAVSAGDEKLFSTSQQSSGNIDSSSISSDGSTSNSSTSESSDGDSSDGEDSENRTMSSKVAAETRYMGTESVAGTHNSSMPTQIEGSSIDMPETDVTSYQHVPASGGSAMEPSLQDSPERIREGFTNESPSKEMHDASTQYDPLLDASGIKDRSSTQEASKPDPPTWQEQDMATKTVGVVMNEARVAILSSSSGMSDVEEIVSSERPDPPVTANDQSSKLYEDFWC